MRENLYTVSVRFYDGFGKFCYAENEKWFLRGNAKADARDWLEVCRNEGLRPTNISVRGHDGRFIKWKN